jgi:hypothetical protein
MQIRPKSGFYQRPTFYLARDVTRSRKKLLVNKDVVVLFTLFQRHLHEGRCITANKSVDISLHSSKKEDEE